MCRLRYSRAASLAHFYILSFLPRPWRVVRALWKAPTTGEEETRYAKWFVNRFFTRRGWRRVVVKVKQSASPPVQA